MTSFAQLGVMNPLVRPAEAPARGVSGGLSAFDDLIDLRTSMVTLALRGIGVSHGERAKREHVPEESQVGAHASTSAAAFGEEQPSGIRHKPLAESNKVHLAAGWIATPRDGASVPAGDRLGGASPVEVWRGPRYVQLTADGQPLGASEGFANSPEDQHIAAGLSEAVRMANGAQRAHVRLADVDVQLVRMNHRTTSYYLAVLTRADVSSRSARLSEMQERVATLAARGETSSQIGAQLGVSVNTVKFHLKRVYELLDVGNRIELRRALGLSLL